MWSVVFTNPSTTHKIQVIAIVRASGVEFIVLGGQRTFLQCNTLHHYVVHTVHNSKEADGEDEEEPRVVTKCIEIYGED